MRAPLVSCLLLSCVAPITAHAGERTDVIPDVAVNLKAARYDPVETDLHWTGWVGAGAGIVRVEGVTLAFDADIETIIGNTRRAFDATQVNYHLQPSIRWKAGPAEMSVFFHHVSRHYSDREKIQAVDWNMVGGRVAGPLPGIVRIHGHYAASLGHTTETALVGYGWEGTAHLDADVASGHWGAVYARGDLRAVSATASPQLPRGGFLDRAIEGGVRWDRQQRYLALFAAWEHRNDVLLEAAGARNRALFGLRMGSTTFVPADPR